MKLFPRVISAAACVVCFAASHMTMSAERLGISEICSSESKPAFPLADRWFGGYADVLHRPLGDLLSEAHNGNARSAVAAAIQIFRTDRMEHFANEAIELVKKSATLSDPLGLYVEGTLKEKGELIDRDIAGAQRDFLKSAELGFGPAMGSVAGDYLTESSVRIDFDEARRWAEKAVEAGFSPAYEQLAVMYRDGLGVMRDPARAFEYAKKGADDGDPASSFYVARAYSYGEGTSKDRIKAYPYARHAYCLGVGAAGLIVAQQLLAEAEDKKTETAMRVLEQLSADGNGDACMVMSDIYLSNDYKRKDPDKAWYYLKCALDAGVERAVYQYGAALLRYGHREDYAKAESLLLRAANSGSAEAAYDLAIAYQRGSEFKANPDKSAYWMKVAAERGSAAARRALASSSTSAKQAE